jgi:hypothetical protein
VEEEKTQPGKPKGLRWQWEKLARARTVEELQSVLAETAGMMGAILTLGVPFCKERACAMVFAFVHCLNVLLTKGLLCVRAGSKL